ncbi:hypothetical protein HNR56_003154 [Roseospira marina]|nr:hypothetical protein [Roseospira marina]MBB5088446.1 hypothetical protein [Roseospira marina]
MYSYDLIVAPNVVAFDSYIYLMLILGARLGCAWGF